MSANPYKIGEKVSGSTEVDKISTKIEGLFGKAEACLKWRENKYIGHVLSLNEILEQIMAQTKLGGIPLIRVHYETGLWGVIFEVGNYPDQGKQWIVHGITKGYA